MDFLGFSGWAGAEDTSEESFLSYLTTKVGDNNT